MASTSRSPTHVPTCAKVGARMRCVTASGRGGGAAAESAEADIAQCRQRQLGAAVGSAGGEARIRRRVGNPPSGCDAKSPPTKSSRTRGGPRVAGSNGGVGAPLRQGIVAPVPNSPAESPPASAPRHLLHRPTRYSLAWFVAPPSRQLLHAGPIGYSARSRAQPRARECASACAPSSRYRLAAGTAAASPARLACVRSRF